MFKNTVEPHMPQITIWRTRIAWWAPKAKVTNSEYVILISFLQQWFHERVSRLRSCYFYPGLHVCRVDTGSRILNLEQNMGWMVCSYLPAAVNIGGTLPMAPTGCEARMIPKPVWSSWTPAIVGIRIIFIQPLA